MATRAVAAAAIVGLGALLLATRANAAQAEADQGQPNQEAWPDQSADLQPWQWEQQALTATPQTVTQPVPEEPSFTIFWTTDTATPEAPSAMDQSAVGAVHQERNVRAFLSLIAWAEGTDREPEPYRVCYAYRHLIQSFREHPKESGEWNGEPLSDAMCRGAGLRPGCVSTAAGRFQIIAPTWRRVRDRLGLPDFTPASQDRAAIWLIRNRGAIDAVMRGDVHEAIRRCRQEWASLPGNTAGQPQRRLDDLVAVYERQGGMLA